MESSIIRNLDQAPDTASLKLKLRLVREAEMSRDETGFRFAFVLSSMVCSWKIYFREFRLEMFWRNFSYALIFFTSSNFKFPAFFAVWCLSEGMKNVALKCRGSGYLGNAIYLAINYPSYKLNFVEQPLLLPRHKSSAWGWGVERFSSRCHENNFSSPSLLLSKLKRSFFIRCRNPTWSNLSKLLVFS